MIQKEKIFQVVLAAVSLLVFPAAFEYRPESPASLFPTLQAVKDETVSVMQGAYSPFAQSAAVSSSVSRPYSYEELLSQQYAAVLPFEYIGLSAQWSSFGMSGYRENAFKTSVGVSLAGKAAFSVGCNWYSLNIQGGELDISKNYFDASASLLLRPFNWIEAGFAVENISAYFNNHLYIKPVWAAGLGFKPFQGLSVFYNISTEDETFVNTLSVTAHILPFLSASLGYGRETMTWAGSLSAQVKNVSVSYGMRQHPYLGATHIVGVTLRANNTPLPSIKYSAREETIDETPFEKVDINSCTDDEIMEIPGINEMYAVRIIRYREMIGPVSEKALAQLGFSAREIVRLQRYIYGLANETIRSRENAQSKTKTNSYALKKKQNEAGRNMFMALVDELGLSPTEAMDLCGVAAKEGRAGFRKKVLAMQNLSDADKQKAEAICARYW